jgi:hypothetical protein
MRSRRALGRKWLALFAGVGLAPSLSSCEPSRDRGSGFVDSEAGAASSSGGGTFGDGSAPPGDDATECTEGTQQIYVVATDKGLYRFYPQELRFVYVGTLGCPTTAGTYSMAIDRRGRAWVEYTDGRLYAVDTNDATCKPTPFKAGQTGFEFFGMGFAMNGDDPKSGETLYVAGSALASLDTKSFDLKFLGSLTAGRRTELTSIGSELYAFSVGSGVVARLNKLDGKTEVTYRTSAVDETAAFAFAHWGGEFWLFTGQNFSSVTNYSPATDKSTVVVENTGMVIVGAGSSTCAPTKRPR